MIHGRRGFTLIELVIIIVLLGVVAAVALVQFGSVGDSARAAANQQYINALRLAIANQYAAQVVCRSASPDVQEGNPACNPTADAVPGATGQDLMDLVKSPKPETLTAANPTSGCGSAQWTGLIEQSGGSFVTATWMLTCPTAGSREPIRIQ